MLLQSVLYGTVSMIVVVRVSVPVEPLMVTATGCVPGLFGAVIVSVVV